MLKTFGQRETEIIARKPHIYLQKRVVCTKYDIYICIQLINESMRVTLESLREENQFETERVYCCKQQPLCK